MNNSFFVFLSLGFYSVSAHAQPQTSWDWYYYDETSPSSNNLLPANSSAEDPFNGAPWYFEFKNDEEYFSFLKKIHKELKAEPKPQGCLAEHKFEIAAQKVKNSNQYTIVWIVHDPDAIDEPTSDEKNQIKAKLRHPLLDQKNAGTGTVTWTNQRGKAVSTQAFKVSSSIGPCESEASIPAPEKWKRRFLIGKVTIKYLASCTANPEVTHLHPSFIIDNERFVDMDITATVPEREFLDSCPAK